MEDILPKKSGVINNQVFVGLPWRNVKPKYEKAIEKLEKRFPIFFTIVGRNDGQDAVNLFEIIKKRIQTSSEGVFDATGGNPNVSLEYGFAEGVGLKTTIFVSVHKAAKRAGSGAPIISDLAGHRRVQYRNENTLFKELERFCKTHEYNKLFDKTLKELFGKQTRHVKKSKRALALKLIRAMDGRSIMLRSELVQHLQAQNFKEADVQEILRGLSRHKVVLCSVGRYSNVRIG